MPKDDGFLDVEMGLPHFEIAPTDAKLKSDCIKLAQHMSLLWQGEVQFLVVATRRDGALAFSWASTITDGAKQKKIIDEIKRRLPDAGPRASEVVLGEVKK